MASKTTPAVVLRKQDLPRSDSGRVHLPQRRENVRSCSISFEDSSRTVGLPRVIDTVTDAKIAGYRQNMPNGAVGSFITTARVTKCRTLASKHCQQLCGRRQQFVCRRKIRFVPKLRKSASVVLFRNVQWPAKFESPLWPV